MPTNTQPKPQTIPSPQDLVDRIHPSHPRIFTDSKGFQELAERLHNPKNKNRYEWLINLILSNADSMLKADDLVYETDESGRRILEVCRDYVQRASTLSIAHRLTGNPVYRDCLIENTMTVCRFEDWNPEHFLDTAEMASGVALAYDWLYDEWSDSQKKMILASLRDKALKPSLEPERWFRRVHHNWNQVCNAGMTLAAIAIMDEEPELSARIIHLAIQSLPLAIEQYEPNGCYPEGPVYWGYGTDYNFLFCAALDSAYGTDFGILLQSSLGKSPMVIQHLIGPSGKNFNYSDNRTQPHPCTGSLWAATKMEGSGIDAFEEQKIENLIKAGVPMNNRWFPLRILWLNSTRPTFPKSFPLSFQDKGGINPVATHRTSWTDPNALYFGIKAGNPSVNHSHMDIGSFVLESHGVRWAVDLGHEEYSTVELFRPEISLWDKEQDGSRWKIFRNGPFSHNLLIIDETLQRVDGHADFTDFVEKENLRSSTVDLSAVYADQLDQYLRRISIIDNSYFEIHDNIGDITPASNLRWAMTTEADVTSIEGSSIQLAQDGKTLNLRFEIEGSPPPSQWQVYSTNSTPPLNRWDSPNPGTQMIGFELTAQSERIQIKVTAHPGNY
tara:strand:+ start:19927 stop:21768 length:1842 start_codon:yes stop_codon:yes gene_type:complete